MNLLFGSADFLTPIIISAVEAIGRVQWSLESSKRKIFAARAHFFPSRVATTFAFWTEPKNETRKMVAGSSRHSKSVFIGMRFAKENCFGRVTRKFSGHMKEYVVISQGKPNMIRGLYNGAAALDVITRQQELISSNLANLNTSGHRVAQFVVGQR